MWHPEKDKVKYSIKKFFSQFNSNDLPLRFKLHCLIIIIHEYYYAEQYFENTSHQAKLF